MRGHLDKIERIWAGREQSGVKRNVWTVLLLAVLSACGSAAPQEVKVTVSGMNTDTIVFSPSNTAEVSPSKTATVAATSFVEPAGCMRPPDDMSKVQVNGVTLNQRTYAMLQHADSLYEGPIDVDGFSITQGSYVDTEPLSFGTHAGGGAVDISVINPLRWEVLHDEVEPLVRALRVAGFAAWFRDHGELAPDSPVHIHAIAIGDPELSPSAAEQLNGPFGYFRGYNGLPQDDGVPVQDGHGDPVLCLWMLEMGYRDLRE